MTGSHQDFKDACLDLAWSLWTELGVSGWNRKHSHWIVDPEELLVFTAWLGQWDARLLEECIDWCILFGDYLSNDRLKNILGEADEETKKAFGSIAATVRAQKGPKFPHPTKAIRGYRPSRKSLRPNVLDPSNLVLRMRKIFGLGAKAEVITRLLTEPTRRFSINELVSEGIGFARVTVSQALDDLVEAEAVLIDRSRRDGQFQIAGSMHALDALGLAHAWRPPWRQLFSLMRLGDEYLSKAVGGDPMVVALDLAELASSIETVVKELGSTTVRPMDDSQAIGTLIAAGIGLLAGGGKGLVGGLLAGSALLSSSRQEEVSSWLLRFVKRVQAGEFLDGGCPWKLGPVEYRKYLELRRIRDDWIARNGRSSDVGSDELLRHLVASGRQARTAKLETVMAAVDLPPDLAQAYAEVLGKSD